MFWVDMLLMRSHGFSCTSSVGFCEGGEKYLLCSTGCFPPWLHDQGRCIRCCRCCGYAHSDSICSLRAHEFMQIQWRPCALCFV